MSAAKRALITGIAGQDGSYLAELLLAKGYEVHGIIRKSSSIAGWRLADIYQDRHEKDVRLTLHYGDITDVGSLTRVLSKVQPEEIYHLAAQSHVRVSFDLPEYTGDATGLGTLRMLEAMREQCITAKFYNAGSSEMFGNADESPINERTPFRPASPYAAAKVFGYWCTVNYREAYGMHACNGMLFNHESPRRGETFVTRKIVRGFAALQQNPAALPLFLGNLDAKRDWGYAPDYVEGMWRILQHPTADDYVLATGSCHSVREFCEIASLYFGFDIVWNGVGLNETGKDRISGRTLVQLDHRYLRPVEVHTLAGDSTKARVALGWKPTVNFAELVRIMCDAERIPSGTHGAFER